ncbi:MAG: helix-turn-helix transcriptional regulator [Candidatus Angelobacter sp.]
MVPKGKTKNLRSLFGKRLRNLRLAARLTQEELAERSEISVDFLSLVERGRSSPSFENLEILASSLRVTVSELFNLEGSEE